MKYNMSYEIAAAIITFAVMLHFFFKKNIKTYQTRLFAALIVVALMSDLLDIIATYALPYASVMPMWLNYTLNCVYLMLFNLVAAIYFWYIAFSTKRKQEMTIVNHACMVIPIAVDIVIIATTVFTHKVIYFDEQSQYQHGPYMKILYVMAALYVIMSLIHAYIHRKKLTLAQQMAVYVYTILSLGATVVQSYMPKTLIIAFTVSIAILLIYLSLENPSDYQDKKLGIFNREAFTQVVSAEIEKKQHFFVIGVQIDGFKYINDTIGVANGDILLRNVADYLRGIDKRLKVFHISGIRFALLGKSGMMETDDIIQQIENRARQPFSSGDMKISLTAQMCSLSYPDQVKRLEDIIDTIDYSLKALRTTDRDHLVFASEEILHKKRRENKIVQILSEAIRSHGFEVYYQPIYSVKHKSYVSAEALIRLRDKEMGFISPDEFIPIAEQNGMILEIGELVFESVCQFIALQQPQEYGIEYIEVNLSVVQCMQEKMHQKLTQIMDLYHIPRGMINLEITETSAVISNDILQNNMKKLVESGSTFALDDYGTGFSNMSHVIEFPFSIVKLDKSMVWAAIDSEKARCALKYTAAMIKAMKLHIVAEGVETLEQAQMLEEYGCDFFQGYYYSKPIPQKEFLEVLKKQSTGE